MLTLETVQHHHQSARRHLVDPVLKEAGTDPERIMRQLEAVAHEPFMFSHASP